jgi:hypothetical protein
MVREEQMTDRELMQKALETFEAYASVHQWVNARSLEVMYALRDRLAQPEPDSVLDKREQAQELRELADRFSEGWHDGIKIDASDIVLLTDVANAIEQSLYTAPVHAIDVPQERVDETVKDRHEWVGLTDDEAEALIKGHWGEMKGGPLVMNRAYIRDIEDKLRSKNT